MSEFANTTWLTTSRVAATTETPPVGEVAPSSAAAEEDGSAKVMVAAGVVLIGAAVAYSLYSANKTTPPQILFPGGVSSPQPHSTPPEVVFVNLKTQDQRVATAALAQWLVPATDVRLSFRTVMFCEESNDCSPGGVGNVAKREAVSAFAELFASEDEQRTVCNAAVVYRCAMDVDGEAIDLMETNAQTLRRADRRPYRERHCVAFTVDGKAADLLTYDVVGVIDAGRAASRWLPGTTPSIEQVGIVEVLRQCCVSTKATLRQHELARQRPSLFSFEDYAIGGSSAALYAERQKDSCPFALQDAAADVVAADLLWRSPFPLFCSLAAALRLSSNQSGGVGRLSTTLQEQQTSALWGVPSWVQSRCATLLGSRAPVPSVTSKVVGSAPQCSLAGHYQLVFDVECTLSAESLGLLQSSIQSIARFVVGERVSTTGVATEEASWASVTILTGTGASGADTRVVADLARATAACNLYQAQQMMLHIASALSALGLPLVQAAVVGIDVSAQTLSAFTLPSGETGLPAMNDPSSMRWAAAAFAQGSNTPSGTAVTEEVVCLVLLSPGKILADI